MADRRDSARAGNDADLAREQYATAISRSQPAWDKMTAHANTGTLYPISEKELIVLQDPSFGPDRPGWRPNPTPLCLAQAHAALRASHTARPTWAQYAARKRLLDSQTSTYGSRSPGLIIKMVNDIDAVLFEGSLRGRITVHWIDHSVYTRNMQATFNELNDKEKAFFNGVTKSLATTVVPPARFRESVRPAIYISAEAICYASQSRVNLIALLIHEMLHAYLATATGGEDEGAAHHDEESGSAAVGHGPLFEAACGILAERLGFRGLAGRDLCWYFQQPKSLVQLKDPERRVKVRLEDGLVHHMLPEGLKKPQRKAWSGPVTGS